ncbi:S-layer protein [Synergistales bacterium]|nr:S-layer protein [Synergistales bacterium]
MRKFLVLTAVAVMVALAAPAFAATNPFMDVPLNHWAYDAIGQLAANGILSGYPDGTYKGKQPTTRYEMASALARALAVVDMTKASKQDVEMMKKLIIEFRDELDALGVKVDQLDKRVSVIESRLGGWKLSGSIRTDLYQSDEGVDNKESLGGSVMGRTRLELQRWFGEDESMRLYIRLNDSQRLYSPLNKVAQFNKFFVEVPAWDGKLTVGRFAPDPEAAYYLNDGFFTQGIGYGMDAWLTDRTVDGFMYQKSFGLGSFLGYISHTGAYGSLGYDYDDDGDLDTLLGGSAWEIFLQGTFQFTEQFGADIGIQYFGGDDNAYSAYVPAKDPTATALGTAAKIGYSFNTLYTIFAGLRYDFNDSVALKGQYFYQDSDADLQFGANEPWLNYGDDVSAWKVIVDIKQDLLKFTSLWLEYDNVEAGFVFPNGAQFTFGAGDGGDFTTDKNYGIINLAIDDLKIWRIAARQVWNDKWATFLYVDNKTYDTINADVLQWALGFIYTYNPNVKFSLAYGALKVDDELTGLYGDNPSVIRFRTHISF